MTGACLACHEDTASQLSEQTGLHGLLSSSLSQNCAKCHSEHHGRRFRLTNRRSFALAGVPDPNHFDHAGLAFQLTGKHLAISCKQCHPLAEVKVLPKGQKRFQGLNQKCTSCHEDVHEGALGQDCAACHGQEQPFRSVAKFQHAKAFPLVGVHGKVACVDCHQKETLHAVDCLSSRPPGGETSSLSVRACRECHVSPHNERFLSEASSQLGLEPGRSCEHCHGVLLGTFRGTNAWMDPKLHLAAGFPLTAPHDNVSCQECHQGFGEPKTVSAEFSHCYPGRSPDDCGACHTDPHQGQFAHGPFAGSECLTCHERRSFRPHTFTALQHAKTHFPLTGPHKSVSCRRCHWRSVENHGSDGRTISTRIFHGTPAACRACHGDPHQGQFEEGSFRGADCLTCHERDSFRPPSFTLAQHDATRFPLTGAHRAVSCNRCHLMDGDRRREAGRDASTRIFHGTPSQCDACHRDVHAGAFDRPGSPAVVAGKEGCARCHVTEGFDKLRPETFDHGLWTGYELTGAHAHVRCAACHQKSSVPNSLGRRFGKASGKDCQSCHPDPHIGQFGRTPQADCSRCHVVSNSFRDLVFDHQTDSRFRLDPVHAKLECSACHKRHRLRGAGTAIRYKPLGTKCGDCHVPSGSNPRRASKRTRFK